MLPVSEANTKCHRAKESTLGYTAHTEVTPTYEMDSSVLSMQLLHKYHLASFPGCTANNGKLGEGLGTVLQVTGSLARAWEPNCKRRAAERGPGNYTASDGKLGEGLGTVLQATGSWARAWEPYCK